MKLRTGNTRAKARRFWRQFATVTAVFTEDDGSLHLPANMAAGCTLIIAMRPGRPTRYWVGRRRA